MRTCLRQDRPGQYQVHAAINAVHIDAATFADTDWHQILALYDQLLEISPTPVIELNRAVAVAEIHGPEAALDAVELLYLDGYHLWHSVQADLLRRAGRSSDAELHYQRAIDTTQNPGERQVLRHQLDQLRVRVAEKAKPD